MLEETYNGYMPLHAAAFKGSVEIASQLVQAGAEINVRNSWEETPLIEAARAGQLQMMHYLVTHGADRDAKDYKRRDYAQVFDKDNS